MAKTTEKQESVPARVGKESEIHEIEMLRERNKELEECNEELKIASRRADKELDDLRTKFENLSIIRAQLEHLATDTDRPSAPQTPEQWSRCLKEILRGTDWEFGTWR